ncbi:MAG: DUF3237 domain-containing protein [Hyphomonadaceae bacterium]|nr:DUF3237 domain-containing protein [Hyphomonadaceae bacterium]
MDESLAVKLEHIFDVRVDFGHDRTMWDIPGGWKQGYTPAIGGTISGPRLKGKVVPHSGADYALIRADGVIELNAHYLLQADDGALIYINNRGYLVPATFGSAAAKKAPAKKASAKTAKSASTGQPAQPRYFRFTPTFRAPAGKHDWLGRTVIVGAGERRSNPDHSLFRYYAVG